MPNKIKTHEAKKSNRTYYSRPLGDVAFRNSKEWLLLRVAMLGQYPLCQECYEAPATEVHHIVPRSQLPYNEWLNKKYLQCLCKPCHSRITLKEVRHGK